jgi:uncharacterized protein YcfJ
MLKKIGISTLVLLALTGCATHQQANTAVGAGTGAIIGNAIGGRSGAAVGAIMGAAIGSNQPTQSRVIVERQVVHPTIIRPDYSMCTQWNHYERESCYRGAEARARMEQNRRNQEAYQQGFGYR